MGSSDGEGLPQLYLELTDAYKKRLMPGVRKKMIKGVSVSSVTQSKRDLVIIRDKA